MGKQHIALGSFVVCATWMALTQIYHKPEPRVDGMQEDAFARLRREIEVIRFAWEGSVADPWALAQRYLTSHYQLMEIRNGTVKMVKFVEEDRRWVKSFATYWPRTNFAATLPDMRFVVNVMSVPRVARNPCFHEAFERRDRSLLATCTDSEPLVGHGVPTADYLRESCPDVVAAHGDSHGFFLGGIVDISRPSRPFPVFSHSKIAECSDDITIPSRYHTEMLFGRGPVSRPLFSEKTDQVYWRGADSGLVSKDRDAVERSHRFRLVNFGVEQRFRTDIPTLNMKFSHMTTNKNMKREYRMKRAAASAQVKFRVFGDAKYNVAIDGHGASMSEFGLFRGNSIVLWSSIFVSYYSDWFKPNEDYHPVKPDMSDFLDVLDGLHASEADAAKAAEARAKKTDSLLTQEVIDEYWREALTAYARAFPGALMWN